MAAGATLPCTFIMELHFSRAFQVNTLDRVRRIAQFWEHMILQRGFRFFFRHINYGSSRHWGVHPELHARGFQHHIPAYEVGLHRPGCTAST